MPNIIIGKVVEVSNTSISVAIKKEIETSYLIINGEPVRIGGVGSFLKIEDDVYEIVNEKTVLDSDTKEENIKISSNRIVSCRVTGYFFGYEFKQGSSGNTPNVFDNVYTVTDEELTKIYSGTSKSKAISIGKYLYKKDLDFYIDINKFFASHSLIVGNTGSGKSNTLNTIFTELFENINTNDSYFLFIDTNGEYSKAFTDKKIVKVLDTRNSEKNMVKIPLNLLDTEDWKLLLEATEKTQYPIIKSVWNDVKKNIFTNDDINICQYIIKELKNAIKGILNSNTSAINKLGAISSIIDDFSYMQDPFYEKIKGIFDTFNKITINGNRFVFAGSADVFTDITDKVIENVDNFSINIKKDTFNIEDMGFLLNLSHLHRTYKYNINENNTSPLIGRFNSNKKDFSNIFLPYKKGENTDVVNCLFENKHVLVCDVSKSKKDIRRIMVTFLCSKLYNNFIHNKRNNNSLHLVVDEAHNYLSSQNIEKEDPIAKTCIETFESIIKEGRKFGVFLMMATQRPSDITQTLLSQSHNYVIHKLVNPRDIEIMKNTVPFIDDMSIKMLSVLSPGQAIFSGTAFNRPNIVQIKFDESITHVESDTIKLMDKWRRKKNFDKESLRIAKEDAKKQRMFSRLGFETSIVFDDINCYECGESFVCKQEEYAPYGMCLNCGVMNQIITCSRCGNEIMTIGKDKKYTKLVYCAECKSKKLSDSSSIKRGRIAIKRNMNEC